MARMPRFCEAPDLTELIRYVERTMDRFRDAHVTGDPRVSGLVSDFEREHDHMLDSSFECGAVVIEPTDQLLAFVAKMRAVERVVLPS